jgi:hypothetical protein
VNLHWQISAGEFFELLRPAALIISALLSTWVLASARRRNFRFPFAVTWAIATFFLPLIVLPLYLIVCVSARRRVRVAESDIRKRSQEPTGSLVPAILKFAIPGAYCAVLLLFIGFAFCRNRNSVDAHLARAEQAKVLNQRERSIREYRAALALENNPHTHKLLGIELANANQWNEALAEFRAAERGGEPDELLSWRIGKTLEALGNHSEAVADYTRFLQSRLCTQQLPDDACETARRRISTLPK